MPSWTVYSRLGCTLCDAFMADLADMLGSEAAARVQVVDVDSDSELQLRYGGKVPVLLADGDFVCCYTLDRERVTAFLRG